MNKRVFFICAFTFLFGFAANAQKIVVDTTSSSKYLLKEKAPVSSEVKEASAEDPTFGDRALSIGKGIVNRLKARLNLEEAAESIKEKKDKLVGSKEEDKDG